MPDEPESPLEFDEDEYQRLYPDVAEAMQQGDALSGFTHYRDLGRAEGRLFVGRIGDFVRVTFGAKAEAPPIVAAEPPLHSIDAAFISTTCIFIVGWFDDTRDRLASLTLECGGRSIAIEASTLVRVARDDARDVVGASSRRDCGFWVLLCTEQSMPATRKCDFVFTWQSGRESRCRNAVQRTDSAALRDTFLSYLAGAEQVGNPQVTAISSLDRAAGEQVLALNRAVTRSIVSTHHVERFGDHGRKYKGSIVVCIYGKPEFMFLQNALFSGKPGIEDYEWVYVCNSPELIERLLCEARIGALTYGVAQSVIGLTGNAGFGAANNVGVNCSRSDRVLMVNPDVFPYDDDWARKHTELVSRPSERTRLFGVPLYYHNGSLMHGGMYFEVDRGLSIKRNEIAPRHLIRIEHYGKGAPPDAARFTLSRPVPAVSGAFMSVDRSWFEKLGGFSEDYVLGHYEDADFCLKSIDAGVLPWLHDIRLWHLDGFGSTRQQMHEGGALINRWLFSRTWGNRIAANLNGSNPPLLARACDLHR